MTTARSSWRISMGWLVIAVASFGQSPLLGDPNCPNCQKPIVGPHPVPAAQDEPAEMVEAEVPVPVVKIKVRGPACAIVGQKTEYRIKVENCSPADAHNVVVKTSFPASVKVVSASPQAHASNPDMQWNLGTLPGYGCHDLVLVVVPVGLFDIKSCTRVSFEHGQCVTTKVMAFAPAGSVEDGGKAQVGGPGGIGTHEPGIIGAGGLYINVAGPDREVQVGQPVAYKITIGNRGKVTLYHVRAYLSLPKNKELEFVDSPDKVSLPPFVIGWPGIEELPVDATRTFEVRLKGNVEGRHCFKADLSANISSVPTPDPKALLDVSKEFCTTFVRGNQPAPGLPGGMTMQMYDRDDPILKDGRTSYVIAIKNQGTVPLTNVILKAKLPPALLDFDEAKKHTPIQHALAPIEGMPGIEFTGIPVVPVGQSASYEIFVKAKGKAGDARFHVEWTADQLDRTNNRQAWIVDEESTTIVADEESRVRMISRKKATLIPILLP